MQMQIDKPSVWSMLLALIQHKKEAKHNDPKIKQRKQFKQV